MKFESSATIKASPEVIWAAVADPREWSKWSHAIRRIKQLSEGPLGIGSRYRMAVMFFIPFCVSLTVTEFVPGQLSVMEGKFLGTRVQRYYRLKPQGSDTRVTAGGDGSGLLSIFVWLIGEAVSEEMVQALKTKIEGKSAK